MLLDLIVWGWIFIIATILIYVLVLIPLGIIVGSAKGVHRALKKNPDYAAPVKVTTPKVKDRGLRGG